MQAICGRGSARAQLGELTALPQSPWLVGRGFPAPPPGTTSPLSTFGFEFRLFGPEEFPSKRRGFCEQSTLLQRVPLHRKVVKHCSMQYQYNVTVQTTMQPKYFCSSNQSSYDNFSQCTVVLKQWCSATECFKPSFVQADNSFWCVRKTSN